MANLAHTLHDILCTFCCKMLPFFGDIMGVVGALGFIPLDFILPMLLYNTAVKPSKDQLSSGLKYVLR